MMRTELAYTMATDLTEEVATADMNSLTIFQWLRRAPAFVTFMAYAAVLVIGLYAMIIPEAYELKWVDLHTDGFHHWWASMVGY